MADSIAVMNQGRIEQLGPPQGLYERPATAFVAGFLGARTSLPGPSRARTPSGSRTGRVVRARRQRPLRAGGRRRAAGEDHARARRRRERAPGTVAETAYIGVATQVVVRTAAGIVHVFAQNIDSGGRVPAPGIERHPELGPESTFVVDQGRFSNAEEESGMNPRLTRQELLRRGAAGGALLAFPSLLAACGGGGRRRQRGGGELKDVLNFSNWPLLHGHERREATHRRRSTSSQAKTGIKVNYFEDINSNDEYFAKIQGQLSQGDRDRPRHHRRDGQLAVPGPLRRRGMGAEARQEPHPEHREPHRRAGRARPSTRTGSTRCRGSRGWTGSPGTRSSPAARSRAIDAAVRGPEAQGQGDAC